MYILYSTYCTTRAKEKTTTVVPTKSDSDVILVYIVIKDLESTDHLFINPIRRVGLINKRCFDSS